MLTKNEFVEKMSKMLYTSLTYDEIIDNSEIVNIDEKKNKNFLHTKYHYLFSNYKLNKVVYFQEDSVGELENGDLNEETSLGFSVFESFSFF